MAEAVFRAQVRKTGLDGLVEVSSAGTGSWHLGDAADPRTTAVPNAVGYGCVVSFTLPDQVYANRFLAQLRLVNNATSFGGVRSTAERRGRWGRSKRRRRRHNQGWWSGDGRARCRTASSGCRSAWRTARTW